MDMDSNQRKRPVAYENKVKEVKRFKQEENKNEVSTFDFKEKTWKEDIVLIVENTKLYVTKAILAHSSPVFDRMFQANFKEKQMTELQLPGKKVEDVQQFLRCIYPSPPDVTQENVTSILSLAEEYQVFNLKSKCEACMLEIINSPISCDELYDVLEQANIYNMPVLLKRCIEVASLMSVQSLHNAEKRMPIQPEVKCSILDKMVLRLQPKNFLEVVKNYYGYKLRKEERLEIRDYANWDGKSLKFPVTLKQWKLCKIILLDTSVECSLKMEDFDDLSVKMKIDQTGECERSNCIQIFGIVVVKPVTKEREDIIKQFKFVLSGSREKVHDWSPNFCPMLGSTNIGYMYHGKLDVELHVLAVKQ